ncbi:MAG: hypothetical protein ABSA83_18095 [Verrucomicrobiota bacterium]|jgi:hypothetical protein
MNPVELNLYFADEELSKTLFSGCPPDGVEVRPPPPTELNAGDATVTVNLAFNVTFIISIPKIALASLAVWMLKQFYTNAKNQSKKTARINNQDVPLQERDILRFIEQQLALKDAQERERQKGEKKKLKNQK